MENYGDALYDLKRRFLIVGLTGYTGSGCTTASKILTRIKTPDLPGQQVSLKITDLRRYEKLKRTWSGLPWERFINIEVSRVIFLFTLNRAINTDLEIKPLIQARKIVEKAGTAIDGVVSLLDRSQDVRIPEIASQVVNAYETFKKLYIPWKNQCGYDLYSFIEQMQDFGDQIRKYGEVSPNKESKISPENIFVLPDIIRRIIKSYIIAKDTKFFVIDAFRNPYEVEYFKRRYSEFYLVAIQRPLRERREALKDHLNHQALDRLETREQGRMIKDKLRDNIHEWITSQNIPECVQKADCFIHNYIDNSKTWPYLRYHLIRLIALTQKPGCIPPESDERNMQLAMSARQNSGCMSRHVGAIVTNCDGYVLGVGWNDPPSGQVPCILRTANDLVINLDPVAFSEYERGEKFIKHISDLDLGDNPFCFCDELSLMEGKKSREYTRALHAEENALIQAMVHGAGALSGGTLFTTDSPCTLCAKKSYQSGVERIVFIEEYPGISLDHSIKVGVRSIKIDQFEGVTGLSYFKLFAPLIPEKDYLKLYINK